MHPKAHHNQARFFCQCLRAFFEQLHGARLCLCDSLRGEGSVCLLGDGIAGASRSQIPYNASDFNLLF